MKLLPVLLVAALGVGCSGAALAQKGGSDRPERPWMVRLRLLSMQNSNRSEPFSAAGTNFPANAVSVSDKIFPEVDLSYFFTKHFAAELILTYPQEHSVNLAGVGKIGTITHLPPTLVFQYHHPIKNSRLEPYIGLGVNFTWITDAKLNAAGIPLDVTRDSVGFAFQIGADYRISKNVYLNLDYKHINLNPNVKVHDTGARLTNAAVDPDLLSVGVGYRF
jgi:outer membrane protein